ncbi:hypothetical protein ORJ04_19905, partial [Rheinheimera baltica]
FLNQLNISAITCCEKIIKTKKLSAATKSNIGFRLNRGICICGSDENRFPKDNQMATFCKLIIC